MRIVQGYQQGRALLERQPGFNIQIAEPIKTRIAEIFGEPIDVVEAVHRIISSVRESGDEAVRGFARVIDGQDLGALEVPKQMWDSVPPSVPQKVVKTLEGAAKRIEQFHRAAMPLAWWDNAANYGEELRPLERVGIYVPGGTASYPSTVLMTAIPAKVAGVTEVIVCSPRITAEVLLASHIAGVDRLFQMGGAHGIAAMAFGTESVPKVDKICGPGNIFVAIAKREVYGIVDIDGFYGPTETILVADGSADPALCAADLLAQAEHDAMASPILITTSENIAVRVTEEIDNQLPHLSRKEIAQAAIQNQGIAVVVETIEEALDLANKFAPEHLCLLVKNPEQYLSKIQHAGGVFLSEQSPEVIGDYVAGPSHVMPTGGTSRFASYLGVHHFLKHMPIVNLNEAQLRELGPMAAVLAEIEGLTAHAQAVNIRMNKQESPGKEVRD